MAKKILWVILLILCGVAGIAAGRLKSSLNLLNNKSSVSLADVDLKGVKVKSDSDIVNILLIGADEREEWNDVGRSDSTMIATMDLKHKRLKLTSLMRDMYVPIPGYSDNKFNAAYSDGGVETVYQTVAQNFGIQVDGYVVVNFDTFTKVINEIGGIEVELSQAEADYLNTTNYIKEKKYRKMKAGKQTVNGSQALGFSRVRYVATYDGIKDDYGRTLRQRRVMQGVLTKLKTQSMSKWISIMEQVIKDVDTDISSDKAMGYITDVISIGTTEIDQLRVPVDGTFKGQSVGSIGDCLVFTDLEKNKQVLSDFIFDYDGKGNPDGSTEQSSN